MKGLLLKDFINLKGYFKNLLIAFVIVIAYAFMTDSPSSMSGIVIVLGTMLVISSFSYDQYAKWDNYALAMPITKKKIVQAKYFFSLILAVLGAIFSFAIIAIVMIVKKQVELVELSATIGIITLMSLILVSIIFPIVYKVGVEKSRLMMALVFLALFLMVTGGIYIAKQAGIEMPSENVIQIIAYLSPILVLILMYISYKISCHIYNKKDI